MHRCARSQSLTIGAVAESRKQDSLVVYFILDSFAEAAARQHGHRVGIPSHDLLKVKLHLQHP